MHKSSLDRCLVWFSKILANEELNTPNKVRCISYEMGVNIISLILVVKPLTCPYMLGQGHYLVLELNSN